MYRNEHMHFELTGGRHKQLLAQAQAERVGTKVDGAKAGRAARADGMNWQRLAIAAGAIVGVVLIVAF